MFHRDMLEKKYDLIKKTFGSNSNLVLIKSL